MIKTEKEQAELLVLAATLKGMSSKQSTIRSHDLYSIVHSTVRLVQSVTGNMVRY